MTDTSTEAVEGPQKDTRNMVDVLLETLVGADRVIIETRNALDLMDAHYLHAPTFSAPSPPSGTHSRSGNRGVSEL